MQQSRLNQEQPGDNAEDNPALSKVVERNIRTIIQLRLQAARARSVQDRIADAITAFSGRMVFVYVHIVWFAVWILLNTGRIGVRPFDPFPYGLLTMVVSLEAIFLATFVLISQNRLSEEADDEASVCDRGFPLTQIQAAGIPRYGSRGPINFTARRAVLPAYQGKGRTPRRGTLVRPLPRQYKHHTIAATPPDRHETWQLHTGPTPLWLHAEFWDDLVCTDAQPGAPTFSTALIHDPRFDEPLLLNTSLPLTGAHLQAFYRDRWPVEGLPLTAKQMLGAARQFGFAPESRQRLPELALVAGAILMYVAATQPAIPTGFWDRTPKPTSGRLRRRLAAVHCADLEGLPEQLHKKPSPTAHLPKGVLGHRRQRKGRAVRYDMPLAA